MQKIKKRFWMFGAVLAVLAASCSDNSNTTSPTYGAITVMPMKDVYSVGDTIQCSIRKLSEGFYVRNGETYQIPDSIVNDDGTYAIPALNDYTGTTSARYWWYASWWYTIPDITADFQVFSVDANGNNICTSSKIVLTTAGDVNIYFFGQIKFPEWNWQKVEIPITLKVVE